MNADRLMRNMMQSMGMGMPFGGFLDDFGGGGPQSSRRNHDPFSSLLPHGFMNPMSMMMMDPFQSMQQAMSIASSGGGNGFSYCSSSVTSYTTDEHGRPQVYQQSNEIKQGPDGLKETKSAVRDSRTGHQELAIGHHLHDKAHIKKKSKNVYTGEEEEGEDLVNLEEDEAETFEQNWMRQARNFTQSSYNNQLQYGRPHQGGSSRPNRLALTSGPNDDLYRSSPSGHHHNASPSNHTHDKPAKKEKKKKKSKLNLNLNIL